MSRNTLLTSPQAEEDEDLGDEGGAAGVILDFLKTLLELPWGVGEGREEGTVGVLDLLDPGDLQLGRGIVLFLGPALSLLPLLLEPGLLRGGVDDVGGADGHGLSGGALGLGRLERSYFHALQQRLELGRAPHVLGVARGRGGGDTVRDA